MYNPSDNKYCPYCVKTIETTHWETHLKTRTHELRFLTKKDQAIKRLKVFCASHIVVFTDR